MATTLTAIHQPAMTLTAIHQPALTLTATVDVFVATAGLYALDFSVVANSYFLAAI